MRGAGRLTPSTAPSSPRRILPSRRRVKLFLVTTLVLWALGSGGVLASNMATAAQMHPTEDAACLQDHSCQPTKTMQPGELIPIRDMSAGGNKTLFESYDLMHWTIAQDQEQFVNDALNRTMNGIINVLMFVLVLLVYMTIGLAWWLFGATSVPGLSDASADLISGASGGLLAWVFPTALAVGALVAYVQGRQAKGSWFGQIAWLVAAGALAFGLTSTPAIFTNGITHIRETGSDMVLNISNQALDGDMQYPLPWNSVDYSVNTSKDAMMRKTGDAIWRDFVATPWCLTQFGSLDACTKYGPTMLAADPTNDDRHDVIKNTVYKTEGNGNPDAGKNSETGQWTKGSTWYVQIVIVLLALIAAVVFCVLLIVLGFSALSSVILTTMLLIAGVFFAALWVIPGRTRQWGVAWAEALVGSIVITLLALLTFSIVIVLTAALFIASASSGWFVSLGTVIFTLFAAFGFRKQLLAIVGSNGSGIGRTFLAGAALTSMATRGLNRLRSRGLSPGSNTSRRPTAGNALTRGIARARNTAGRIDRGMQKGSAVRMRGLQQQLAREGGGSTGPGRGAENSTKPSLRPGPTFSPTDRGTPTRELTTRAYAARTGRQPAQAARASRTPSMRAAAGAQQRAAQQARRPSFAPTQQRPAQQPPAAARMPRVPRTPARPAVDRRPRRDGGA